MSRRDMDREGILEELRVLRSKVANQFGVERLGLFGSAARDALRDDSDIDVLVSFHGPATLERFFGLKQYLEEAFGHPVDLVTERGLKPLSRASVEQDLIRVP